MRSVCRLVEQFRQSDGLHGNYSTAYLLLLSTKAEICG